MRPGRGQQLLREKAAEIEAHLAEIKRLQVNPQPLWSGRLPLQWLLKGRRKDMSVNGHNKVLLVGSTRTHAAYVSRCCRA